MEAEPATAGGSGKEGEEPMTFALTTESAKKFTCLRFLSVQELAESLTFLADGQKLVPASFVSAFFATIDKALDLDDKDELVRAKFVANIAKTFTDPDTGLVSVAELAIGLSLFCNNEATSIILLAVSLYGGTGGLSTTDTATCIDKITILNFLQQVSRAMLSLSPLEDSYESDINATAMHMTASVLASITVQADGGDKDVGVPIEVFAEWLGRHVLIDAGESVDLGGGDVSQADAAAQQLSNNKPTAAKKETKAPVVDWSDQTQLLFEVLKQLYAQAQKSQAKRADTQVVPIYKGAKERLNSGERLPVDRADVGPSIRAVANCDSGPSEEQIDNIRVLLNSVITLLEPVAATTAEADASETGSTSFEHLFVALQFVLGGGGNSSVEDQAALAFLLYSTVCSFLDVLLSSTNTEEKGLSLIFLLFVSEIW